MRLIFFFYKSRCHREEIRKNKKELEISNFATIFKKDSFYYYLDLMIFSLFYSAYNCKIFFYFRQVFLFSLAMLQKKKRENRENFAL